MADRMEKLAAHVIALDSEVGKVRAQAASGAIERWRGDAQALLFHLRHRGEHRPLAAVLGGTGTGKSTLVNRLLNADITAASFRRTFTSGAVAIAFDPDEIPGKWLGLPRIEAGLSALPARGETGKLLVVSFASSLTQSLTLVDTPDLDGDQPVHHAEADRVFRWVEAAVFVVTPEKYQMTELLPYYRLARRYALPALFVMNKCEEASVLEDYRRQLAGRDWPEAVIYVIPRDDAAYEPPPDANLDALRAAATALAQAARTAECQASREQALRHRSADLLGRLRDQVLSPWHDQRREIDHLNASLAAMTAPPPGIDVSPVTTQLQRRLQEQSVLYLMGPQRILQRVRQMPGLLARLPRTAWDLLTGGQIDSLSAGGMEGAPKVPDFPALLTDQFRIVQSRIDDLLLTSPAAGSWLSAAADSYASVKIPPEQAGQIAEEELASLNQWLQQRWQQAPRDTAILQKLLRYLPGGRTLTKWSETAPYLLAVVLAAHGAFFGHLDLIILGSYTLATWVAEKLSNEVASRTRQANRQIADRFASLAQEQTDRVRLWLDQQAPSAAELKRIDRLADEMGEMV